MGESQKKTWSGVPLEGGANLGCGTRGQAESSKNTQSRNKKAAGILKGKKTRKAWPGGSSYRID